MVIFDSYVKLPEGTHQLPNGWPQNQMFSLECPTTRNIPAGDGWWPMLQKDPIIDISGISSPVNLLN